MHTAVVCGVLAIFRTALGVYEMLFVLGVVPPPRDWRAARARGRTPHAKPRRRRQSDEPRAVAAVTFLMLAVACAAAFLPARRASAADPIVVVRGE